jgi:hypothetical protein
VLLCTFFLLNARMLKTISPFLSWGSSIDALFWMRQGGLIKLAEEMEAPSQLLLSPLPRTNVLQLLCHWQEPWGHLIDGLMSQQKLHYLALITWRGQ